MGTSPQQNCRKLRRFCYNVRMDVKKKQCPSCKSWLSADADNFYLNQRNTDGLSYSCKSCLRSYQAKWAIDHPGHSAELSRQRRDNARGLVDRIKLERGCDQCGYIENPAVLHFHHNGNKTESVARMVSGGAPLQRIMAEIDKCELLCLNCHFTRHRRGST